jgi:hypothetical protein
MARHLLTHVEQIEHDMKVILNMKTSDVESLPLENVTLRFTTLLQHNINNINQVVEDMLPELEQQ